MRRPLLFGSFCLVALIALIYCRGPAETVAGPPDGTQLIVTGQVCDKDDNSFEIQILEILSDAAFTQQDNSNDSKQNKLIISCDTQELFIGAEVTIRGDFYHFSPATNPGEFDYAKYYHSMGYLGRIYDAEVLALSGDIGLREYLYRLRMMWKARLYEVFPEKEASVMAAILLGEKQDVDEEIRGLYERNGIVHILSISGLHITIIGMGLYKLLRKLGVPVWAAAIGGAVILILYGIMTGFGVSVCRAVGMYLLRMLGVLWGRTYDMLTALGFVGALMAVIHPAWLGHMGYLLSFGSVLGLGLLLPALVKSKEEHEIPKLQKFVESRMLRVVQKIGHFVAGLLREGLLAGVSITMTTLPIQLWFSYEISIYSVFLNALILPLMSAVMIVGLVVMIVPGTGIAGTVDVIILTGYEGLCHVFENLPEAIWNPGRPTVWQLVVYYLLWAIVVWGIPWLRGVYKRAGGSLRISKRRVVQKRLVAQKGVNAQNGECRQKRVVKQGWFVVQMVLLVVAVGILALPKYRGDRVTFLDVGQGDCICIQLSSGEVYLFDCGSSSRKGIGENVLIPFLKYYGISEIDAVFASHGDADHTNGLEKLIQLSSKMHVEVGQLVLPYMSTDTLQEEFDGLVEVAEVANVPVRSIAAGEIWNCGEDSFVCLHPAVEDLFEGNAGSECFYVMLRENGQILSLLLTGDVEKQGEEQLTSRLAECGICGVDVLKVGHHGSKYSSSQAFLTQANPRVAIISCGRKNFYGHPHGETLERLEQVGSRILTTPKYGAVTIELGETCELWGWLD